MEQASTKEILLVALGGNALVRKGQIGTIEEQFENLRIPMGQIARLSQRYRIIITHGNAPQVGNLLLQQECCDDVPKLPLEILVAQTQGQMGYMLESTLDTALMELGLDARQDLVSLISYVVVDENDPAFQTPSKPIGPLFSEQNAAALPYPIQKTAKGWRRVVASPIPQEVVEIDAVRELIDAGTVVITVGGGGIPVIRQENGDIIGTAAVIDKDYASSLLARLIKADVFIISTAVEKVAINFGKPDQKWLDKMTVAEAKAYLAEGTHFAKGSMAPKVQAIIWFLENGGKRAIITNPENIGRAIRGETGTLIVP